MTRMTETTTGSAVLRLDDAAGDFALQITVTGRVHPDATDFADANWLRARVGVRTVSLHGTYEAQFRSEDFAVFRAALGRLMEDADATARFSPMEPWLELEIAAAGDGTGYAVEVIAREAPEWGATLTFVLQVPLAAVADLALALDGITERFPVVGAPDA